MTDKIKQSMLYNYIAEIFSEKNKMLSIRKKEYVENEKFFLIFHPLDKERKNVYNKK